MRCHRSTFPCAADLGSVAVAIVISFGLLTTSVSANPNNEDPEKPLQAHNTIEGAEKQIQAMYAKFAEWEKLVISSTEAANEGRRFPHSQLSKIYPETYRGIWYAEHLQAMGEPAGHDLRVKFTYLRKAMGTFASKLHEFQPKEIAELTKETPNRRKTIASAAELASQGNLVQAEREIQRFRLKQLESVFYLGSSQSRPFENEIAGPHNQLLSRLSDQRRAEYQKRALEKINSYGTVVERLKSESERIASELKQSPATTLADGQTGDAADALRYLTMLWGNASAAVTRSVAVAWAFNNGSADATAEPFARVIESVDATGTEAVIGVLNSAVASTPNDQIPVLLPRLLTALSELDRRYSGDLDDRIKAAVTQLTAKNASVAEQSRRYSAATAEPTRWMQRYALQQVENQRREYPPAAIRLNQELTPASPVEPAIYGSVANRSRILTPGSLGGPASWMAGNAAELVGTKVTDDAMIRLSPTAKLAIVAQEPRHYSGVPASFPIDRFMTELNDCLLLDASHGPLDLSAADAQSSAQMQEFQHVGGRISKLTLEPFVSRFATMPDEAHVLVPLNRLPSIDSRGEPVNKVIWRLDLQPDWVAHRLFFAAGE